MTSSMYIGPPSFPVFNDHLPLNMEAIADGDLIEFVRSDNADMSFAASAAWSSDCEWYFIVLPETGIALFNVFDRRGILCKRPTGEFIGHCLKTGMLSRSLRSKRKTPYLVAGESSRLRSVEAVTPHYSGESDGSFGSQA